jgi:hypothetical protein
MFEAINVNKLKTAIPLSFLSLVLYFNVDVCEIYARS